MNILSDRVRAPSCLIQQQYGDKNGKEVIKKRISVHPAVDIRPRTTPPCAPFQSHLKNNKRSKLELLKLFNICLSDCDDLVAFTLMVHAFRCLALYYYYYLHFIIIVFQLAQS